MFDLTRKNALVTGASGGIGAAVVRALHAAGLWQTRRNTILAALADDHAA